ncbi:hypothetical protein CkaCkLH20_00665 [Colletotrichum karsti]|uniref:Aminoglycoside phosphotransferase domain-containing protein n=1 Tax=Colletotrichum karsti TaxID=1095194 RepID=A0A9P6LMH7_9PEZI|nr:uncharacterized protein CkaCkLH20_00665 [Colletotrichum karsti]KAF9881519.1 hypothetical protein CkaCkLH20_00665 [Colletotrichum karsti]
MTRPSRDGLYWEDGLWDITPRWAREPSIAAIEKVCRRKLGVDDSAWCDVSFFAEGAFNKLYLVKSDGDKRIMRVSLPVCPGDKTRGEVATLSWIRRWTDVPVPEVFTFNDSNNDEIGFEWILMEFMPGASAYSRWRGMSMAQKTALVEKIADYQAQILNSGPQQEPFRGIGTPRLESSIDVQSEEGHVVISKMMSLAFFWGDNYDFDVPRGPFRSSHDWLSSLIRIIILNNQKVIREAEDEDDKEDAERTLPIAQKLLDLLPRIFPAIQHPPERTFLQHNDLSLQNILVDDNGNLTAILDWECVSAVPLWAVTSLPDFLSGLRREEKPNRDRYADESESDVSSRYPILDNEGKQDIYWDHLLQYEQTRLREAYAARMRKSRPDWETEVEESLLKTDFLEAIHFCRSAFHLRSIPKWIDSITAGKFQRLGDMLYEHPLV